MTDVSGWVYIVGESPSSPEAPIFDRVVDARAYLKMWTGGETKVWRVPITAHLDRASVVEEGQES